MKFYTNLLLLGISALALAPSSHAGTSENVLSCGEIDTDHRELLKLTVTREEDGRYFYRATRCTTIYLRNCLFSETGIYSPGDYVSTGYVEARASGDHSPHRFGDGNISIYPAGDIGYVINDDKARVQFTISIDKCDVKPQ